jgi:hypothetical protein
MQPLRHGYYAPYPGVTDTPPSQGCHRFPATAEGSIQGV